MDIRERRTILCDDSIFGGLRTVIDAYDICFLFTQKALMGNIFIELTLCTIAVLPKYRYIVEVKVGTVTIIMKPSSEEPVFNHGGTEVAPFLCKW